MNRYRDYYRSQRKRAICRKKAILLAYGGKETLEAWTHGQPGRLSKGKIHCSCPMCRKKSYDEMQHRDRKWTVDAKEQLER